MVVYVDAWDSPVPQTLYISPTVQEMLGHPPELFLEEGARWLEIVHPDDLPALRAQLAACAAADRPYEMHYRFLHPEGRDVWVRDRATPYRDPETGERRWMGALEDVTDRVEAEQARALSTIQYETLLENIPAVVYETDPDDERRTVYMNRKIEDLLGYTMEEWLDQPDMWIEVLHPDDRERELAAHDLASTTGDPWAREYRMIGAEGQVVWLRDQAVLSARRRRERHPLAGRDDGHHRREGSAARACRRPRRARVPRSRTHRGPAGDERIDGHRDRRAPARRGRASARGTAARPHPRQRPGRRLPLADARGRRRDVLVVHHAEDRRDARVQPDGVGRRWLAHPAASAR